MCKIYQKNTICSENPAKGKLGGFTLIELLVVVLIIGILAAIALPNYQVAVMRSRIAALLPAVRDVYDQKQMFYLANGRYPSGGEIESPPSGFRVPQGSENVNYLYGTTSRFQRMWVPGTSPTVLGLLEYEAIGFDHQGLCMAATSSDFAHRVCLSYTGLSQPTSSGGGWDYYDPNIK